MRYFIHYEKQVPCVFLKSEYNQNYDYYTEVTEQAYNMAIESVDRESPAIQEPYYRALDSFRKFRKRAFEAFDIYKSNVGYGIISETEESKRNIVSWYSVMLSFPETITPNNYDHIVYPPTPLEIQSYL